VTALPELLEGLTPGAAMQVERAWQLLLRLAPDGGEALDHPRRVAACMHRRGERDGGALAGALLHDAYEAGVCALVEIRQCAGPLASDVAAELASGEDASSQASALALACDRAERGRARSADGAR
jgi:hypothetical protein